MARQPAVAGSFYPAQPEAIGRTLDRFMPAHSTTSAVGVMVPHAGWLYSGKTCGEVIRRVVVPDCVVILCPNHTGLTRTAAPASVYDGRAFVMPCGVVPVNQSLATAFMAATPLAQPDPLAHIQEHAIEVILPFLMRANPNVSILPIVVKRGSLEDHRALAQALVASLKGQDHPFLMVASSDMTHYCSAETARRQDESAIERIEAMDPEGLLDVVRRRSISMCGVHATTLMLLAARELGACGAELVDYSHSGMVTGDLSEVVAYAGMQVA